LAEFNLKDSLKELYAQFNYNETADEIEYRDSDTIILDDDISDNNKSKQNSNDNHTSTNNKTDQNNLSTNKSNAVKHKNYDTNSIDDAETPKLQSVTNSIEISHAKDNEQYKYDANKTVIESARKLNRQLINDGMQDEIRISFDEVNSVFNSGN
jgi:hypothetical protein